MYVLFSRLRRSMAFMKRLTLRVVAMVLLNLYKALMKEKVEDTVLLPMYDVGRRET